MLIANRVQAPSAFGMLFNALTATFITQLRGTQLPNVFCKHWNRLTIICTFVYIYRQRHCLKLYCNQLTINPWLYVSKFWWINHNFTCSISSNQSILQSIIYASLNFFFWYMNSVFGDLKDSALYLNHFLWPINFCSIKVFVIILKCFDTVNCYTCIQSIAHFFAKL